MKIFKQQKDLSIKDVTFQTKLKFVLLYTFIAALVMVSIAAVRVEPKEVIIDNSRIDTVYVEQLDIPLTDSAILRELVEQKCMLPAVALAQMKLETGNFTSAICKENKNIAGIRTSRSKYVIRQNRSHCVYNTYKDCIKDYVRVQNRYLKNIDGKYAESKNYIQTLRAIK